MKIEVNEGIRVVKIHTDEYCETVTWQLIKNWMRTEYGLRQDTDYTCYTEWCKVTFKFYDKTNDCIGRTPKGFETIFALKWAG